MNTSLRASRIGLASGALLAAAALTACGAASSGPGGPVPIGFAARSVTFVSTEEAFVLGTAPCAKAPCTSILRTLNCGASWRGLPAPVVPLAAQGDAVIVTSNGGISTVDRSGPCNTTGIEPPVSIAVTGSNGLAVLCAGNGAAGSEEKTVWVSDDLGAHWAKAGSPDRGGIPEGMSAGSPAQLVVSAASGASWQPVSF